MIDCKTYVAEMKQQLKQKISELDGSPILAIIQVGDNPQSNSYVKFKLQDAEELGIKASLFKFDDISEDELKGILINLSSSPKVNGIIVQLPLPKHLNIEVLQKYILAEKDVDGFRDDSKFSACTAQGVIDYLKYNNVNLEDKNITLIGRGKTAGAPLKDMLIKENANLTLLHSKTSEANLDMHCFNADIIISAVGKSNLIKDGMVTKNTICIDIGRGDFSDAVRNKEDVFVTPVNGGVGIITRYKLMENVVKAYNLAN